MTANALFKLKLFIKQVKSTLSGCWRINRLLYPQAKCPFCIPAALTIKRGKYDINTNTQKMAQGKLDSGFRRWSAFPIAHNTVKAPARSIDR